MSVTQPLVSKRHKRYNSSFHNEENQIIKSTWKDLLKENWKVLSGLFVILTIGIIATSTIGYFGNSYSNAPHSAVSSTTSSYEAEEWLEIDHIDNEDRFARNIWEYHDTCSDDTLFTMKILPVLQNMDKLHSMIMEVSHPKSEKYGKYYDLQFINNYFSASDESIKAIYDWLESYGFDINMIKNENSKYNGDMIEFETTCGLASQMLNTEYVLWKHSATGDFTIGVKDNYYVPLSLSQHIDLIGPTLRFPLKYAKKERLKLADMYYIGKTDKIQGVKKYMQNIEPELEHHLRQSQDTRNKKMLKHQKRFIEKDSDFTYVYPEVLWTLYSMDDYKDSAASSLNKQAFGSWLSEYTSDTDTTEFDEEWGIEFNDLERIPSSQPTDAGDEASLDLQYITTTGQNIYTQEWYTDDESDSWMLTFLVSLKNQNTSDIPYVISISYGAVESESGEKLVKKANSLIGTLSLLGMTFLASSGDSGAAGDGTCDGIFSPQFPTDCPYVLSIGGVYGGEYPVNHSNTNEETWYYGGGGFSNFFDRETWADYQDDAVNYWLANYSDELVANSSWYNSSGRGYPDISAQSYYFLVVIDDEWWLVSGTSASCPTIAGQIALLNDLRFQNDLSALGLIHWTLYEMWDDLDYYINDVTTGYNEGCEDTDDIGFYATEKWDPATGLGTPKFDRWVKFFVDDFL